MGKRKLYLLKYYCYISVLIMSLLQGCSNNKEEEIERITSPDSLVDAVLIGRNGGATTSYSYTLYLVPSGKEPIKNREVFRANHTTGLSIHWINPTNLEIAFDESQIFHFTNFWSSNEFDNPFYIINIRLKWKTE
jgi:hypothetical protein